MGRGAKRPRKTVRGSEKAHARDDDAFWRGGDMDDEVDAFHKQRDVIPLDPDDDIGESEDEDLEEPVFDIEGTEEDESDDAKSVDEGIKNVVKDKGLASKIVRQAKYLQQKFGGGDDEMDDHEEEKEERKAIWGRGKNMYYDADNVDYELQSSDEELPLEEEAEVLKIQREKAKSFSLEDFGLEEDDHDESDSDGEKKINQDTFGGKKSMKRPSIDGALEDGLVQNFEKIKKDFTALSKVEQMDVVYSSAPELVGLLSELNVALEQIERVKPNLCKVVGRKNKSQGGLQYLEVKHILLLTYCQAITFYLLLKSEGNPVRDHPVIGRLVEIKNLLQKMEEIEVNLPSVIENMTNDTAEKSSKHILSRESVLSQVKPDKFSKSSKLLKLTSDSFKELNDIDNSRSANEMKQDVQVGLQSLEMLKIKADLEAKLNAKGIYRSASSKTEKMPKASPEASERHLVSLDDFDDEVHQTALGESRSSLQSRKIAQLVGTKANKIKSVSGDDDLPKRDDIGERRRRHELRVLASAGAIDDTDEVADEAEDGGHRNRSMDIAPQDGEASDSENEFYKEVKRRRTEKLMAKAELYSRTPAVPLPQETEVDGKRQITQQMDKNRGLTRPRKKLTKNPRKKYRVKHRNATIRRKGQVRDIRKLSGPYGGEHTGINMNVSRSVRFKN